MEVLRLRRAGLDVHKDNVVAAIRSADAGPAKIEVRSFGTTTPEALTLSTWLAEPGRTPVAIEATGVYGKPVCNRNPQGPRGDPVVPRFRAAPDRPRRS